MGYLFILYWTAFGVRTKLSYPVDLPMTVYLSNLLPKLNDFSSLFCYKLGLLVRSVLGFFKTDS